MLAPLLFNIFFAAVINVVYVHFKADKYIMSALVYPRKKNGGGWAGKAYAGEPVLAMPPKGMFYADDAGLSRSPLYSWGI